MPFCRVEGSVRTVRGMGAAEGQGNDNGMPRRQNPADVGGDRLSLRGVTGLIPTVGQIL